MINVLMLVSNLRETNGVASFAVNYFKMVDSKKIHIDFALYADMKSPYYELIQNRGGKIYILPGIKNMRNHIRMCKAILEEGHYDIIHNTTLHITIPMMWCAKKYGVPVRILHSHSSKLGGTHFKELRNKLFVPFLCSLATHYVACSGAAGKALFGNRRFEIIPNVIPVSKYKYDQKRRDAVRASMNAESKIVVGSVGRMAIEKNPYFAIEVFQKLLEVVPNAEYWWAGSGPLDEKIKKYIIQLGLTEKIHLLGSRNDIDSLYQAMDVLLMPSQFEGLGLACIEAQAAGLPCVVSNVVPHEVKVTEMVSFVSLKCEATVWMKQIVNSLSKKNDRYICNKEVERSIFSDSNAGATLYDKYSEFLRAESRENRI